MISNQSTCECNDYSHLIANTGMVTISSANPAMDGTGSVKVLEGGLSGTTIKSITIKATQPTTAGMVRLFIGDHSGSNYALYKEVPIPTTPSLTNTPTPVVVLPMFEITLEGGFKLAQGMRLYASTQNEQSFNIIAEGVDWMYPALGPTPVCCAFLNKAANTGIGTVNVANSGLDGSGAIQDILTVPSGGNKGTTVHNVVIKALQATSPGMVRLYLKDTAAVSPIYVLYKEIQIPETNQGGKTPSFKQVVSCNINLQDRFVLSASTEVAESFAITAEGENWSYA